MGLLESRDVASIEYTANFVAAQATRFDEGDKKLAQTLRGILATQPSETLASAGGRALCCLDGPMGSCSAGAEPSLGECPLPHSTACTRQVLADSPAAGTPARAVPP